MQGWRKLHLGIDESGVIVAQVLTDANGDDATNGIDLIDTLPNEDNTITRDTAYDTRPFYAAAERQDAKAVVPPIKKAKARNPRRAARDCTIRTVERAGRRQWKKEAGYHQQARAENTFFRLKSIFGDRLRARGGNAQSTEARLVCNMLNRMTELGRPASYAIER